MMKVPEVQAAMERTGVERKCYTTDEVATMLGISMKSVYRCSNRMLSEVSVCPEESTESRKLLLMHGSTHSLSAKQESRVSTD